MSIQRPLKFGVAYHGNRFLSHAAEDLRKIVAADMDIVVHMFSHNDWERHDTVMGDMFKLTESMGLEVWVDNWGIGGAPGEILKVPVSDGADRYDFTVEPHNHVKCEMCGAVDDVFTAEPDETIPPIRDARGFTITRKTVLYYGLCPDCAKDEA